MDTYTKRRPMFTGSQKLALAVGLGAVAVASSVMVKDASTSGLTIDHITALAALAITTVSGKLLYAAWRDGVKSSAVGFAVLLVLGTIAIVISSVGSQTDLNGKRQAEVARTNQEIESKKAEISATRERINQTIRFADREAGQGGCKSKCGYWKDQKRVAQNHINILEKELQLLGTRQLLNPKAAHWGKIASVLGGDGILVEKAIILLDPILRTLLLELAGAWSLGFAFYRCDDRTAEPTMSPRQTSIRRGQSNDGADATIRQRVRSRSAAAADLHELLDLERSLPSQSFLADRWGVHKGTVSKWLDRFEREGLVRRSTAGRCKMVAFA